MLRLRIVLIALGLGLGTSGGIVAQSGASGAKRPLDLPSGGKGVVEDDEKIPESISFYGFGYEGDGFFWCLDKSGSMSGDLIAELKAEMTAAISQLSESSQFSIVAFSTGTIVWSQVPKEANAGNRASATAWVQALEAEGSTCLAPAGVETIGIANLCDREDEQILVLSDGVPNCPGPAETLSTITAANWQHIPIHTVYIASDAGGIAFMQQLAAMNGGTFHQSY